MDKKYFSVLEASKELNVSRSLIYSLVESNQLTHLKVGKTIRLSKQSLTSFIKKNTIQGTTHD